MGPLKCEQHFKKFDATRFSTSTDYDISKMSLQNRYLLNRLICKLIIDSIMHYKSFVYAKNDSVPTIRSKKGTTKKPIPVESITGFLSKVYRKNISFS